MSNNEDFILNSNSEVEVEGHDDENVSVANEELDENDTSDSVYLENSTVGRSIAYRSFEGNLSGQEESNEIETDEIETDEIETDEIETDEMETDESESTQIEDNDHLMDPVESVDTQLSAGSAIIQQQPIEHEIIQQSVESEDSDRKSIGNTNRDEAFTCPICLEYLTNAGLHKPVCLKCGHIFGKQCLLQWLQTGCSRDGRRCPSCNAKASIKDIRLIYAKSLCAIDTAELTAVETKLNKINQEKHLLTSQLECMKVKNQILTNEINELRSIVNKYNSERPSTSISPRQCIKTINISKTPSCRVMAFSKAQMLLAVSHSTNSLLFNTSHAIRKVNTSVLELSKEYIFAHAKPIRDMSFHPYNINILASVSLDKTIKLSDMISNTIVSSVTVDEPLWSCCWSGDNCDMLIAGGQGGALYYVDRRYMKIMRTICRRTPACVSLVPLQQLDSRAFHKGGFLKTRMDAMSVFEHEFHEQSVSNYKETELPLKGLWSSTSYDSQSNLILSTSKPCGPNKSVRHIISRIADRKNVTDNESLLQPIATFFGGDKATQLTRSCIVPSIPSNPDTLVASYDEREQAIKLFSVNLLSNIHNYYVKENFLDLCPLNGIVTNGRRTLAALSEGSVSIFTV